jgi:cell division protein FtsW
MQRQIGYILLVTVLGLIALGMVMLFSTSARFATHDGVEVYVNLKKQAMWLGLGSVVCIIISRIDYHVLVRYAPLGVATSVVLLLLVFVPGLSRPIKGAYRWISIGGMTLQPSEFAKLALIFFLSWWMSRQQRHAGEFIKGFLIPGLVTGFICSLVLFPRFHLKGGDLGATAMLGIIFAVVLFCSGAKKRYLFPVPIVGLVSLLTMAYLNPVKQGRLLAFLDPEKYKEDSGYQVWQALIALGSGGIQGLGLGNSRQKMSFLPEAHNDFIFPIIGEELGMWVALGVVTAFLVLVLCSGWITIYAPDSTGVFLGVGITTMLGVQALINLAVVTSMMPNKGMPLPFISYGGSNLLVCLTAIGVLFNLQRQGKCEPDPGQEELLPPRVSPRM